MSDKWDKAKNIVTIITTILTLAFGSGFVKEKINSNNEQIENLTQIQHLFEVNKNIKTDLDRYKIGNYGVMESYVIRVNNDKTNGIKNNLYMRKLIDTLETNNQKAFDILEKYERKSKTDNFKTECIRFKTYLSKYKAKYECLIPAMSLDNLPNIEPFSDTYLKAIDTEIQYRKSRFLGI